MGEDLENRQPVSSPPSEQASVTDVMPPWQHFPYPAFSSLWEDEQVLGMTRAAKIFPPRPCGSQREIASEAEDSEFTTEDVPTTSGFPQVQSESSTTRTETRAQWVDDLRHDYPLESLIPVLGPAPSTDATELRPPQSQSLLPTINNNVRFRPIYPPPPTSTSTTKGSDSRRNSLGQIDTVIADDTPANWTPLANRARRLGRRARRLPRPTPLPPKAYPLTPTLPWLGASAAHLSILSSIVEPWDMIDDDGGFLPRIAGLLCEAEVDPGRLCEDDRRLLFVLDHAVQTGGAERCGLDAGADKEGGAVRFLDLRRSGGEGGEGEGGERGRGGQQKFVDVSLRQFLDFLREALNENGSSAQLEFDKEDGAENYDGGDEAAEEAAAAEEKGGEETEPIPYPHRPLTPSDHPPAAERVPAEASGSPSQTLLQDEAHPQPAMRHWELLLQKLEEHNLSLSDVSEAQIQDWISVPIDAIEGYFETHLRHVLRWKKMKNASKKTKEDVVRERAALAVLNEGAGQNFAPARDDIELATLSHAGNVETNVKTDVQPVNAQISKTKTGTYVILAVGFILTSGLVFGLVFGLRSRS